MGATSLLPAGVAISLLLASPAGAGPGSSDGQQGGASPLPAVTLLATSPVTRLEAAAASTQDDTSTKTKKKKKKKADEASDEAGAADKAGKASKDDGVRWVWKTGPSLRIGKQFRMDVKALLQGDYRQSEQDLSSVGGSTDLPRSRLGVKGDLFKIVEYEVTRDFSEDKWRDVYVNVRPIAAAQVQGGQFKVPFSLDQMTAPHSLDFVYRTLAADTLAPNRDVGFMLHGQVWKRFLRYEVGAFRGDGENAPAVELPATMPGEVILIPSKRSYAGRVRVRPLAPLRLPKGLDSLEVGAAFMQSEVPEGPNHLQGKTLFGTAHLFSRQYYVSGPRKRTDVAFSWTPGPVSIRGEYMKVKESRIGVGSGDETALNNDLPELPSTGWYFSGTWAITGDKKESDIDPKRPFLQGGFGAIEVAARYEAIEFGGGILSDLPSKSVRATNTITNMEHITTIGVNWYLNRFVKVQLNGIQEKVDDVSKSPVPGKSSWWSTVFRFQFSM